MHIRETTTVQGSGFWGYGLYDIELTTRATTYTDSSGTNTRTVHRYVLNFGRDNQRDIRAFASDRERADFIDNNFTERQIHEIPLNEQVSASLPSPLDDVIGEYLSDVTFVMDYLQMRFCGPSFNFYNWPAVILDDEQVEVGKTGYRDALCSLIGKTVRSLDVFLDTGLTFKFQAGETVAVSLRVPHGSSMPEVAEYSSGKKSGFIWMAGEAPFD